MHALIDWIVATVGDLGYAGIFFMMFLESSFFPFPSEVVMIPAGYLAHKGEMNLAAAIFWGIAGSLAGALFNYWLALKFGRAFILHHGRYFFFDEAAMNRMEVFFARHGHVSTFTGRLIPAVRQYISLPAGLARMNLAVFSLYTSLGAGLWVALLAWLGYAIGDNKALLAQYQTQLTVGALVFVAVVLAIYVGWNKRRARPCPRSLTPDP